MDLLNILGKNKDNSSHLNHAEDYLKRFAKQYSYLYRGEDLDEEIAREKKEKEKQQQKIAALLSQQQQQQARKPNNQQQQPVSSKSQHLQVPAAKSFTFSSASKPTASSLIKRQVSDVSSHSTMRNSFIGRPKKNVTISGNDDSTNITNNEDFGFRTIMHSDSEKSSVAGGGDNKDEQMMLTSTSSLFDLVVVDNDDEE